MTKNTKIQGGPGCGKTYNLMQYYRGFTDKGFETSEITFITFRKTSAASIIAAVAQYTKLPEEVLKPHVGTIHSICLRLLGYPGVIGWKDKNNFLKASGYSAYTSVLRSASDDEEAAFSGNLFDLYTWLRNTCTPAEQWFRYPGSDNITMPSEMVPKFIQDYEDYKTKIGKIDFTDMLQSVIDNKIPLDTPILMIDEFQDLTAQMYKLFQQWTQECEYTIVAGDPFQSIYGFWGGSPDYFNNWTADIHFIPETRRLPQAVYDFASSILKFEGMHPPYLKGKPSTADTIQCMNSDGYPAIYPTELHLVRCNYQANDAAMQLALDGKVFGGLRGWTSSEMQLANAIIKYRQHRILTKEDLKAIVLAFPPKLYGNISDIELERQINRAYNPSLRHSADFLKPVILSALCSDNPTIGMKTCTDLAEAKLCGILKRTTVIMSWETINRKILTIHGSKGLEADAVFLHTGIVKRIKQALAIPGAESEAEARVWFVGATRAKEKLILVKDSGYNYSLPEVC